MAQSKFPVSRADRTATDEKDDGDHRCDGAGGGDVCGHGGSKVGGGDDDAGDVL